MMKYSAYFFRNISALHGGKMLTVMHGESYEPPARLGRARRVWTGGVRMYALCMYHKDF